MENEIWKDIKGYDGKYQISNKGNIKNVKRNKLLKIQFNKNYKCIHLVGTDGKIKNYTIHRLMAQSFIPNPDNLSCVNHKDENKLNNSLDNLEWCTKKYNCNYGTAIERTKKQNQKTLLQYDLNNNFIKEWNGLNECAKSLNVSASHISQCCNNKRNKAYNYIWKYKRQ